MNTLILAEGRVTPCCSKSHITYCFNLDKAVERLNFDFSYKPKKLLDREKAKELISEGIRSFYVGDVEKELENWESHYPIDNLLTVSADDSKGFRGCAHRQSPEQQHFIAEDTASHGFIPGRLERGIWRVTLNLHVILTEYCNYKLHVWEGFGNENMDSV